MTHGRAHTAPAGFALAAIAAVVLCAGCGSSKPAYCAKVSDLKKSVQKAATVDTLKQGPSGISSAIANVKSASHDVVSAAKNDFPSQTKALTDAVGTLAKSGQALTGAPVATIAGLPGQVSAVTTAVNKFADATSSKCSGS
jgi:hypothetical protein